MLNKVILNIIFAVLTYMFIYLKISRVGRDENLFIFFQKGDKKIKVGRVSRNTAIFFALLLQETENQFAMIIIHELLILQPFKNLSLC